MAKDKNEAIGKCIRNIRRSRGWTLRGLSPYVPVSTLHAIETGHILPSRQILDSITNGLEMPRGSLDIALLRSVRNTTDRKQLVARLISSGVLTTEIQRALRQNLHNETLSPSQQAEAQLLLAQLLMDRKLFRRAVIFLKPISRAKTPGRATIQALLMLGQAYLQLNEPHRAIEPLLHVQRYKLDKNDWAKSRNNLALAWWRVGQYEEATKQWQVVRDAGCNPELTSHAVLGLGNVALRQHDYPQAEAHFQKALLYTDLNASDRLRALNNLLVCYVLNGSRDKAHSVLSQIRELAEHGNDVILMGEIIASQASFESAMGHFDTALGLVDQAKQLLGNSLTASWFSVRLLELSLIKDATSPERLSSLVKRLDEVKDQRWGIGVRVAMVEALLNAGHVELGFEHLRRLRQILPEIL